MAPGPDTAPTRTTGGTACQSQAPNQHMPLSRSAGWLPYKSNQAVASRLGARGGAGMTGSACPIHLTSGNSGQSNTRAFGAPDWPVAVPDPARGALEGSASWDSLSKDHRKDHKELIAPMIPTTKAPTTNAVITQYSIAMARCFQRGSSDSCLLIGANMQIGAL